VSDLLRLFNPLEILARQRGHLFPWVPVCLAFGIGIYFALPVEPAGGAYAVLGLSVLALLAAARWLGEGWRPVFLALSLVLAGVMVAGLRAHMVKSPVLSFRYYGPVQGRIVKIDRSMSDKLRLTLDNVVLERMDPARTPANVRVALHGKGDFIVYEPGQTVILTAHMSPPNGPVEPGGFDFQRKAWFDGLGAVGYTRTPVLLLERAEAGKAGLFIHRLRMRISAGIQSMLGGDVGAFAAAIMTGDRSGMRRQVLDELRASNLAHLLAISGLHMGLLTAFVFGALRYGLALIPVINLRWPIKKIAAGLSLLAAAAYLLLSGGNIATERAFIMVAVMLVAVMLGRRALTLRAVALAAVIVLIRRPEALTGPGFQMSFAATTALVAVFGMLRHWDGSSVPAPLRPVLTVMLSSFVAGMATAPVAAAHFNQIAHYGLLANVLTVPLMGVLVMPAAVLAAFLYPLGLSWIGLEIMRWGILWILGVAKWVAGMEGALSHVVTPMPAALPLIAIGGLLLFLWRGPMRFAGVAVMLAGFFLWSQTQRPALLISQTGGLVGLIGDQGRALSKPRGDGFAARNWLENDGEGPLPQTQAFARAGFTGAKGVRRFVIEGQAGVHLFGKGAGERLAAECVSGRWIITTAKYDGQGGCQMFDANALKQTGAVAIYADAEGPRVITAKEMAGERLWNSPTPRRKDQ